MILAIWKPQYLIEDVCEGKRIRRINQNNPHSQLTSFSEGYDIILTAFENLLFPFLNKTISRLKKVVLQNNLKYQ